MYIERVIKWKVFMILLYKNNGESYKLEQYKGTLCLLSTLLANVVLPQFEGLQKLYDEYKDQRFIILGFPCNQFGGQEPGSGEEAAQNCKINYGVTFPIHEKVDVKGDNQHPLFHFLTNAAKGMINEKSNGISLNS